MKGSPRRPCGTRDGPRVSGRNMELHEVAIWLSVGALIVSAVALWVSWAGYRQSHRPRVTVGLEWGTAKEAKLHSFLPHHEGPFYRVTIRNHRSASTTIEALTMRGRWPRTPEYRILNTWPTSKWPVELPGRSSVQLLIDGHELGRTVYGETYHGHPVYQVAAKLGDGRVVRSRWRPWWWPNRPPALPSVLRRWRQRLDAWRASRADESASE